MDNDPETLLRRLHDRDAEIGVLLQRAHLLNRRAPPAVGGVIDHGFELHGGMGSYDEMGSYGALKEKLFVVCGCQEKVRSCHQCGLGTLWARTTIQSSPDKRGGHIYCCTTALLHMYLLHTSSNPAMWCCPLGLSVLLPNCIAPGGVIYAFVALLFRSGRRAMHHLPPSKEHRKQNPLLANRTDQVGSGLTLRQMSCHVSSCHDVVFLSVGQPVSAIGQC